jgi:hypothetical protein
MMGIPTPLAYPSGGCKLLAVKSEWNSNDRAYMGNRKRFRKPSKRDVNNRQACEP